MARRSVLGTALLALALFGCSSSPDGTDQQTSEPRNDATSAAAEAGNEPADDEGANAGPGAKLLKTGFGQRDEYAWVTSLVQNQSDDNIGRLVTVQFNLYDKGGDLIQSTDQVESFSRADQKMAIGTQVDLDHKKKVAKVEATLALSDYDGGADPSPEIKTGKVKVAKDEYGSTTARFEVYNSAKEALKNVRVGVICYDTKDRVNGGGSTYPDLVPPSGKVLAETDLILSGKTDRCEAYAGPGEF